MRFVYSLIVVTIIGNTGSNLALAADILKKDAEKRAHMFVWDAGVLPGIVDAEDDAVDFEAECDTIDKTNKEMKSLIAQRTFSSGTDAALKSVLQRLKLQSFNFSTSPIDAYYGDPRKPTFLIFPERHLYADKSEKNIKLHEGKLKEMVGISDALLSQQVFVFNAIEGPRGYWSPVLNRRAMSTAERKVLSVKIVREKSLSGGDALAELYLDNIPSFYVDEPGMNVKWLVTSAAKNIKLDRSFDSRKDYFHIVQKWFDDQGASSLVEKYNLQAYFNDLMAKSPKELVSESTNLCEARSRKFVENTFLELPLGSTPVVFLSIGSLHIHGVRKKLLELDTSFVIFSPHTNL